MQDFAEPVVKTLIAAGAHIATVVGTSQGGFAAKEVVQFALDVTAIDGVVTDTLDVVIYASPDKSVSWLPAVHFPEVLGNATPPKKYTAELLPKWATPATTCNDVSADPAVNTVRPYLIGTSFKATATIVGTPDRVVEGLLATAHAPADLGLNVSAGTTIQDGAVVAVAEIDLVIPTADGTHPRIDIIVLNSDGVVQGPTEDAALKGAPGVSPSAPATPGGALLLADISVLANATSLAANKITDERSPAEAPSFTFAVTAVGR